MNTIAQILTNSYSDQGVQDFKVFLDSYFFNLKVKKDSKTYNLVLIEKTEFDYNTETIEKKKSGLTVNFGDSGTSDPFKTSGNNYIDSFLDARYKTVLLVGTRKMSNGNVIPVIFIYDINKHLVNPVFPKSKDITEFNSFSNYNFQQNTLPVAKFIKNQLFVAFITESGGDAYINKFTFSIAKDKVALKNYEVYKYLKIKNIKLNEVLDNSLHFSFGNYKNVFKKLKDEEFNYDPSIFTFSDYSQIFALDDSMTVLVSDYSEKILKTPQGLIGT
jgi:hypothetical protein